ncbi:MAG TPA: M20/M25/M40 family metallo-hydrolase, partial [Pseudonocardiaceae bacterium]|nr:M20/M25/M40 family metallo-hydrolase [Pseudonocardiaceae bacterium]
AAEALALRTVWHAPATRHSALRDDVPLAVRRAVAEVPGFLRLQPSLVLRLGPTMPRDRTIMFNVHLDTVAGMEPVGFDGTRFTGRGAIDAKGPAVALLAGLRAALAAEPAVGSEVGVLLQAVAGEEGGAMGTIGTRPLVERGFVGRLNVFCEPTDLRYLPRATASMTACVRVAGRDAIDDQPEVGHNATVLLGFLAQHLGATLVPQVPDGRVCIAGMHTGRLHNRVYGSGELLVNLSYASVGSGAALETAVTQALCDGVVDFAARFASLREFARTAVDAARVTRLEWHKRGLPTLAGADEWCEALLREAGIARWPDAESAFTCDAIWMNGVPGAFTVVLGPGVLGTNNAHAQGEYAELAELNAFATAVARIVVCFARRRRTGAPEPA